MFSFNVSIFNLSAAKNSFVKFIFYFNIYLFWPCMCLRISGQAWTGYCVSCHRFYSTRVLVYIEETEGSVLELLIFWSVLFNFWVLQYNGIQLFFKLSREFNFAMALLRHQFPIFLLLYMQCLNKPEVVQLFYEFWSCQSSYSLLNKVLEG